MGCGGGGMPFGGDADWGKAIYNPQGQPMQMGQQMGQQRSLYAQRMQAGQQMTPYAPLRQQVQTNQPTQAGQQQVGGYAPQQMHMGQQVLTGQQYQGTALDKLMQQWTTGRY